MSNLNPRLFNRHSCFPTECGISYMYDTISTENASQNKDIPIMCAQLVNVNNIIFLFIYFLNLNYRQP